MLHLKNEEKLVALMRLFLRACSVLLLCYLAAGASTRQSSSPASIHGYVTDYFGQPLSEATVELLVDGAEQGFSVATDERGNYKITGMPAGTYNLVVALRGFKRETERIYLQAGESRSLNVGLEVGWNTDRPLMEVTGVVRQDNGPVPDATITLANAFNRRESYAATTDRAGRFKIKVNNPGQYLLQASKPGLRVGAALVVVTSWGNLQRQVVNLFLSPLRLPDAGGSNDR
jgi:hypothetical protein